MIGRCPRPKNYGLSLIGREESRLEMALLTSSSKLEDRGRHWIRSSTQRKCRAVGGMVDGVVHEVVVGTVGGLVDEVKWFVMWFMKFLE